MASRRPLSPSRSLPPTLLPRRSLSWPCRVIFSFHPAIRLPASISRVPREFSFSLPRKLKILFFFHALLSSTFRSKRERVRESLEFTSLIRVCFVTTFFFLPRNFNQPISRELINFFLFFFLFISTVNKEISLVNARICEKMNRRKEVGQKLDKVTGEWKDILGDGQEEACWSCRTTIRNFLETVPRDSRILSNFSLLPLSPCRIRLFIESKIRFHSGIRIYFSLQTSDTSE